MERRERKSVPAVAARQAVERRQRRPAADAAAKLRRKYLGIDASGATAVRVMRQRLASRGGAATPVIYKMGWEDYQWQAFERRALMHESDAEDARYFTERGEVIAYR